MDKFIKRELWPNLIGSLAHRRIVALLGPRRVGKTVLLKKLIEELKVQGNPAERIFYYNLDDVGLRAQVKQDFRHVQKDMEQELGASLDSQKQRIFLFIDEAQKAPDLFELVKIFYDEEFPIKTFLSGSSSLDIRKQTAETLGGRIDCHYLYPLTLAEATELSNLLLYPHIEEDLSLKFLQERAKTGYQNQDELERILRKILLLGSLPEIYLSDKNEALELLNNFIATYLDKDIRGLEKGINIEKFQLSFQSLAEYTADLINFAQISQDTGIKRETISNYFELLENTLVVQTTTPYTFPELKNLYKGRKLFFFDGGVVNRLRAFLSLEEVERAQFLGSIFENFIFQNLRARMINDIKRPDLYFLRDYQGHEIDFVYRRGEIVVPIEATYATSISWRKLKNMSYFLGRLPKVKHALIFYRGDLQEFDLSGVKLFALPYFMV